MLFLYSEGPIHTKLKLLKIVFLLYVSKIADQE